MSLLVTLVNCHFITTETLVNYHNSGKFSKLINLDALISYEALKIHLINTHNLVGLTTSEQSLRVRTLFQYIITLDCDLCDLNDFIQKVENSETHTKTCKKTSRERAVEIVESRAVLDSSSRVDSSSGADSTRVLDLRSGVDSTRINATTTKGTLAKTAFFGYTPQRTLLKMLGRVCRGAIIYGEPGTGKTNLILAEFPKIKTIALNDIIKQYVGDSERGLHSIFEKSKNGVFIDEIDAISGQTRLIAQLLWEIDHCNGFVVLATNFIEKVDKRLLRSGRCEMRIEMKGPDKEDVLMILKGLLGDCGVPCIVDLEGLVEKFEGKSCAEIAEAVRRACLKGARRAPMEIREEDFM